MRGARARRVPAASRRSLVAGVRPAGQSSDIRPSGTLLWDTCIDREATIAAEWPRARRALAGGSGPVQSLLGSGDSRRAAGPPLEAAQRPDLDSCCAPVVTEGTTLV